MRVTSLAPWSRFRSIFLNGVLLIQGLVLNSSGRVNSTSTIPIGHAKLRQRAFVWVSRFSSVKLDEWIELLGRNAGVIGAPIDHEFSGAVPITVHELEYYDEIAGQTPSANSTGYDDRNQPLPSKGEIV